MPAELEVDWLEIQMAACAGVPYPSLAAKHGISSGAIRQRAFREKWPVPASIIRRAKLQGKAAQIEVAKQRAARNAAISQQPNIPAACNGPQHNTKDDGKRVTIGQCDSAEACNEAENVKEGNQEGGNGQGSIERGNPDKGSGDVTPVMTGFSARESGLAATVTVTEELQNIANSSSLHAMQVIARSLKQVTELPVNTMAEFSTGIKTIRSIAGLDKADVNVQVNQLWQSPAMSRNTDSASLPFGPAIVDSSDS